MASEVRGLKDVNRRLNQQMERIGGPLTERFVTEVLIQIGARAAEYTPVDTSRLINSQWRQVRQAQGAWVGMIGYGIMPPGGERDPGTGERAPKRAQDYAVHVHDGPNKNWQKASASNKFLAKGVEDAIRQDLQELIRRNFNL